MRTRANITREAKARLIADLPHYGNADLAHKYGISTNAVAWHRKNAGIPCPRNYVAPQIKSQVISLRTAHNTIDHIVSETGLKKYTVQKILHDAGFDIPTPARPASTDITPENCEPACYDGLPEPTFDWDSIVNDFGPNDRNYNPNYGQECRERYEQLRKWKSAKAKEIERRSRAIYEEREKNCRPDGRRI